MEESGIERTPPFKAEGKADSDDIPTISLVGTQKSRKLWATGTGQLCHIIKQLQFSLLAAALRQPRLHRSRNFLASGCVLSELWEAVGVDVWREEHNT